MIKGLGGATILVEEPTDYERLRIATLKDPEGNLIQLRQRVKA
jgi:hypothetical protein